jgi:hypothetical protein
VHEQPRPPEAKEPPGVYGLAPETAPAPSVVKPRRGLSRTRTPPRGRPAADGHRSGPSRAYLWFLVSLALVWAILAVASWFFPITAPICMSTLGFGPALFLVGYLWIMGLAVGDGDWLWLFPFPIVRGRWIVNYYLENPERAAKPFFLAMLGAGLFVLTFAMFLLKQQFGLL